MKLRITKDCYGYYVEQLVDHKEQIYDRILRIMEYPYFTKIPPNWQEYKDKKYALCSFSDSQDLLNDYLSYINREKTFEVIYETNL